jgi:signal transduction histidine kinase
MPRLSIRARLIFLSVLLLLVLAISSALLIRELARDSEALDEQAQLVSIVRNANTASKHFGDLKYWLTDYAITLLTESQKNAEAAKAQLGTALQAIRPVDPAGVSAILHEVETLATIAREAGETYANDDSTAGNKLMTQARDHIINVDRQIEQVVDRLEQQALARRDASMRDAERAVNVSVIGGILVLTVVIGLSGLVVRSIIAPLRRLEHSMAAITRGDLDAPIPPAGRDEIGAMSDALGMLRHSLIARERLEGERKRAEAEMRAAQANLIHSQKMAALGQLTAGIAHEIKNPLNFVNNFATLSVELLDELKDGTAPGLAKLDDSARAAAEETIELLTGNLEKIAEHGRRADGIVKSMLLHSRGGSGERQSVDINSLAEEALLLTYHGARAQDQNFNITLERDFDAAAAPLELVPQDITRVLLNLIGNGFYAAHKRKLQDVDAAFRPTLTVTTRDFGDAVEVRVRDNGTGVAPDLRDKLFQPFFTTKPTGEGTGLGLSISYDIVTQQHGGTIEVDSEPGSFTEFKIRLPRDRASATTGRAA